MQKPSVSLVNLTKVYGKNDLIACEKVNIEFQAGHIIGLLGPNGAGKSTVLNILCGKLLPSSGTVTVCGSTDPCDIRSKTGFVSETPTLDPNLTVKENIEVCKYLAKDPLDMDELLDVLGLTEHQNKFPAQLSGGQQQRCAIARALIKNPKLLLCDEPTGALDSNTSRDILILLEKINERYGTTMLIVTHNNSIKNMVHKVIFLKDGLVKTEYMNEKRIPAADLEDLQKLRKEPFVPHSRNDLPVSRPADPGLRQVHVPGGAGLPDPEGASSDPDPPGSHGLPDHGRGVYHPGGGGKLSVDPGESAQDRIGTVRQGRDRKSRRHSGTGRDRKA